MSYEPALLVHPQPCQWFAHCTNTTHRAVDHPVLGWTPICPRCAKVVGMELEGQ